MSSERRESFRCLVPFEEAPGVMRVGTKDMVVHVLEESAGGFAVRAPALPEQPQDGDRVVVATGGGCCEVRIIHQTEVDGGFRIGLQRLRDVKTVGGKAPSTAHGILLSVPNVLGAAVVFSSFVLIFLWSFFAFDAKSLTAWVAVGHGDPRQSEPFVRVKSAADVSEAKLAANYFQLGDFKTPEIVRELALDKKQQQEICGIMKETTAALSAIYERREDVDDEHWAEIGLQVMQRSKEEVLSVMTEDQQRDWLHLHNAVDEQEASSK